MRKASLTLMTAAALMAGMTTVSYAGAVERACRVSGRPAATPSLCSCIQSVADKTLSGSDQREAAKFFKDPDRAQEVKMSDRRSHSEFWQRYKRFGATAERNCS